MLNITECRQIRTPYSHQHDASTGKVLFGVPWGQNEFKLHAATGDEIAFPRDWLTARSNIQLFLLDPRLWSVTVNGFEVANSANRERVLELIRSFDGVKPLSFDLDNPTELGVAYFLARFYKPPFLQGRIIDDGNAVEFSA